ncbi:putative transcriptional regulator, TetR family [Gordonia polyisoprenivorans VH2]|uniref:TetR/AcrR family transcriptional regulator n=2 Tax=Gordonia polyisoprenivorans TaxID=84595 RepID=A0A846WLI8_9ACTN|nr:MULTISPECIES: TetR family transcriptional regulator [Gordonia]AFA72939.1 putative transcriptional regulator, TetR family [Gordonia polyisoprenivorans VH2]MDF3285304.1 TetR family transcriptional regulator [Gordonia sp. N1V]NKY02544.1 TetR/AcrR family transcriptional regulator [Gordonia polyisoprenivorans]OPX15884.1 TetR family transcriptional regulator [Gordonia sp. i37]OZC30086.1 TetR/AcrR family transcriptional regulator [Gordonia polyisoprenivorans]
MTTQPLVPRKRPTQERSKRKFSAMLAAARELLTEVGFESLTCEEIASRAEVPIGTLYQYFANKYVIVCELDRLDTVAVREELTAFASEVPSLEWPVLLEKFLDHLAALWRDDPSRRAVWLAVQSTPATRATASQNERVLADQVSRLIAPLTPSQRARREMMSQVLVHTAYSLLSFSVQDGHDHPETVTELKRMLAGYLLLEESTSSV